MKFVLLSSYHLTRFGTPTRFQDHDEIPSCRAWAITGVANCWRGDAAPSKSANGLRPLPRRRMISE